MMVEMTIEELALSIKTGKTPSTRDKLNFEDGDYNWFTPGDFRTPKILNESKRKITEYAAKNNAVIYQANTILITCIGDIGNAGIIKNKASANQQITGVVVDTNIIEPEFFLYWIKANKKRIQDGANQAVVPIINNKGLKRVKVTFPSDLPTQNKIVALLDKASALVQQRETSINLLDELLRAQFFEMFGKTINNNSLKKPLGSQIKKGDKINYGIVQPGKEVKEGISVVRVGDFMDGRISLENIKKVSSEIESKHKNSRLYGREILIACVGATIGKVAFVDEKLKGFNIVRATARVNCGESLNPTFLLLLLQSNYYQSQLKKFSRTVAQPTLNIKQISELEIPIPPIEIQNQFEVIYHTIQDKKETLTQSKNELENLFNSLLQRAFSGQLNFNVDIELDTLLAAIDIEKDTEKEKHNIKEIATVYASRLLERIEEQKFENRTQYQQAKQVVFQMLEERMVEQAYDKNTKAVKLKLV